MEMSDRELFRLTAVAASLRATAAWVENGNPAVYAVEQLRKEAARIEEIVGCRAGEKK